MPPKGSVIAVVLAFTTSVPPIWLPVPLIFVENKLIPPTEILLFNHPLGTLDTVPGSDSVVVAIVEPAFSITVPSAALIDSPLESILSAVTLLATILVPVIVPSTIRSPVK